MLIKCLEPVAGAPHSVSQVTEQQFGAGTARGRKAMLCSGEGR